MKFLISLLLIALVTSKITAENQLHKEYKSGKVTINDIFVQHRILKSSLSSKKHLENTKHWLSHVKTRGGRSLVS